MSLSNGRKAALFVWAIASLFYAYQYILRVMPNIMLDEIMQRFDISTATFGQFSGVYYLGYSLMHLPVGIMLDRYGPKKIMSLCILLTVIGLTPLLFAEHWIYPIFGRLLIGIGSSAAILGLFKIIRMTFSEERFSRMLSLSVTIGLIGAIYGGGPVQTLLDSIGYQSVIVWVGFAGLLLALATYWIVPDVAYQPQGSVFSNIREVISNRRVIGCSLFAGLMVGPLEGFADVWGTSFLKSVYGFDGTVAASLPSLIFVGMCFGSPVLNFISERTKSTLGTIMGAGAFMAVAFTSLILFPLPSSLLSISFIAVGVCCAYQILAIYKASTYVREEVAGLTTAVANMIIMIFGYAFHALIGATINAFGGASSATAFLMGIGVIPVALMVGTVGFFYLSLPERSAVKT